MSILTSSGFNSKLLWILLVAGVTRLQANRLDDASYSGESDFGQYEEPSKMANYDVGGRSASFANIPRDHRHSKYHSEETTDERNVEVRPRHFHLPMGFSRPRHRSSHGAFKNSPDSGTNSAMHAPRVEVTANEKPTVKLPERFSYVAQQFYEYVWEKRNNPKTDERENAEGEHNRPNENAQGNGNVEDGRKEVPDEDLATPAPTDEPVDPVILWRNIIGAPPSNCKPGEQRDMNGRCRTALW